MATKRITNLIKMLTEQQTTYPSRATIFRIDGSYLDVRFGSSPSIVRNVDIVGDPYRLAVGDEVLVYWESVPGRHGKAPVVYVSDSALMVSTEGGHGLPSVDGITIDYGVAGLHVPRGGIALENLSFLPSLDGHKHRTPLEEFGWNFTNDGIMFANDTYIHPDGQIAVGTGDNTVKLDSLHATYRLWAGAQDPTAAPFSVTKAGAILASSGVIAGWNIYEQYLDNNDVRLDPDGEITVGAYGTNDVAVLSTQESTWRLWIGHADAASAPFRVSKTGEVWLDNAHVATTLESANYSAGLKGWKLDPTGWAEFQDVVIRGTLTNVVFQYDPISIISGRIRVTDSVTLIADLASTDLTMDVNTDTPAQDEIIQFKTTATRKEWIRLDSGPITITGGFRYDIVRDLASTGAQDFYISESGAATGTATFPDDPLMFGEDVFGAHYPFAGRGYSALGGFLTLDGSRQYGPYFGVARRFGANYDQIQDVARFGLLSGFLGETREVYGIAMGDVSQFMKYSYEDGLSIQTRNGLTTLDDRGLLTDAFGMALISGAPSYVDQIAFLYVDETDKSLYCVYKDGAYEYTKLIATIDSGTATGNADTVDDLHASAFQLADSENVIYQDWMDETQSAGYVSGCVMSDNMDGTIAVASGYGFFKHTDDPLVATERIFIPADVEITLVDNVTNYIYVDYDGGTPSLGSSVSKTEEGNDVFYIGKVFREDTNLHIVQAGMDISDLAKRIQSRFNAVFGELQRASGMVISESGTRSIAMTAGVYYAGLTRVTVLSIDTNGADTFEYYYLDTGAWVDSDESQIDNLYYNDVSSPGSEVLALVDNNKFVNHWVYCDVIGDVLVVYGQTQHTKLSEAEAEEVPTVSWGHVSDASFLIGRITIEKSATSFDLVTTAFGADLSPTVITDHGDLANLLIDDHTQYILHSLADAADDFLVASGDNVFIKKTLAEVGAILEGDLDHGNLQGLSTGADHSYIDQDVTSGSSPTLDGTNFTGVPDGGLDEDYLTVSEATAYVLHSLADAENDFLVASGDNTFVKKTLAEVGAILEADLDHGSLQGLAGDDHTIYMLADGTRDFSGDVKTQALLLVEQAAASADVESYGQIWVKTESPNTLWFTDDAGTDFQLNTGAGSTAGSYTGEWDIDGALIAATEVGGVFIVPASITIVGVYVYAKETGSASSTIVDINKNGTTVYTTQGNRPTIAYDDADGLVAAALPDVLSAGENDLITIDIDQVATGSGGLSVVLAMVPFGIEPEVFTDIGSGVELTTLAGTDKFFVDDGSASYIVWSDILAEILSDVTLDEDDMTSNSDVKLATQQSIKKYVDDNTIRGIADDNLLEVDGTVVDNDYLKATANGAEGKTLTEIVAELRTGGLIGIGDNDILEVDGTVAANDIMQATASGLKGLTYAELVALIDGNTAGWTFGGTLNLNTNDIDNARSITFITEVDNGNSSTADTIDFGAGQKQKSTMTDDCTYTFTAPDGPCNLVFKLIQGSGFPHDPTWPASVKWPGGIEPTWSEGDGEIDLIGFYYDGTTYHGSAGIGFA